MFIHSETRQHFIEVSPDGVIRCTLGPDCPYKDLPLHITMGVEVKYPYLDGNIQEYMFYQTPTRYVHQVLAQMVVLKTKHLLLLCRDEKSVVAMIQQFHDLLWNKSLNMAVNLYGGNKPNVPTRLHPLTQYLRIGVSSFHATHSSLFCEVPCLAAVYGTLSIDPELPSPCIVKKNQEKAEILYEEIQRLTKLGHTECLTFFNQAHTTLQTQAHEVIVFMLTEKNRIQHDSIPYAYPVAYALKGASMSNADLRYLVDTVREACRDRKIPLLCKVYDGQWQNFITTSCCGEHLTKLHARNSWNRISALRKDKVLEEMYNAFAVRTWDLDFLGLHKWLHPNES